jgi:hypothetical protein
MGCKLEFTELLMQVDFCIKGSKQKVLIDVLTKYSDMDFNKLAYIVGVSVQELYDISSDNGCLIGESADSLAQLFLMFLGQEFFRNCTLVRRFF